jgi:glutamine amidotransferase
MITIINYGLGNLGSILNMFKRLNFPCEIASDQSTILKAKKILLPGVGAFDTAIQKIDDLGFREILGAKALVEKVPFLGICLGMQLLTNQSEEGKLPGLGFVPGSTVRFNLGDPKIKIPHMGWNIVHGIRESQLLKNMEGELRFYFVHSYHVVCDNPDHVVANTNYGYDFNCIVERDNIYGAQFHPEKSHRFGMNLLKNFAEL